MGETENMIHPWAKFLTICGTVKLEPKLPASEVQWWDRPNIGVIDNPLPNRRKQKK